VCVCIYSEDWVPVQSQLEAGINGLTINDVSDGTKIVSARRHVVYDRGEPVVQPIVHSATYMVKSVQEYQDIHNQVYVYVLQ